MAVQEEGIVLAGISSLVAAQLSMAAYPGNAPPAGWTAGPSATVSSKNGGTNSFTVFLNSTTHQAVFTFKGSDNFGNFQSDLLDSGGQAWVDIKAQAQAVYNDFIRNPAYSGYYQIMTDGHSLGGGMAQTFALENNLSGYGQNSLPISSTAISADGICCCATNFDQIL